MLHASPRSQKTIAAFVLLASACGSSLPRPALVLHPSSAYVEVPYPPPAALAETVPPRPKQGKAVWVEGSWQFRGKTYSWQRGGWFIPPDGARYARSDVAFPVDGRVLFAPGIWYDAKNDILDQVRPTIPAATPSNDYTSETETAR
jgi:hypothetical protein